MLAGWTGTGRGICGGSHGGFPSGTLYWTVPRIYEAAAMRNPVTNVATMTTATDINDWCFVEAFGCGNYQQRKFRGATPDRLADHVGMPVRFDMPTVSSLPH
jgi:acylaminoacyl-peptidase